MTQTTCIVEGVEDYVTMLLAMERSTPGPVCFASSFLSSIYFPETALRRFYGSSDGEFVRACAVLLERQKVATMRRSSLARRELYEASAFRNVMAQGLVHEQEANYRIHPSELQLTLHNLLAWTQNGGSLEIAITTEILPLVFTLAPPDDILIDIRANYLYQRIQGIHICSDERSFAQLHSNFERLWASAPLKGRKATDLIARGLRQWQSGWSVDLTEWPEMQTSERR